MRTLLALLALLVLVAAPVAAQSGVWVPFANSPTHGYRFEDASFVTPLHGWIVDGSGETYETTDGGTTWTLKSIVPGYHRTTAFVSETHGWVGVLFSDTRLYETADGGTTMVDVTSRITPAIPVGVCGLFALSPQRVVGVGEWDGPAFLIETTDGGATWASRNMAAHAGSLIDVYYHDAMNGVIVGGTLATQPGSRAVVLTTENGGATWTRRGLSSGTGTTSEWAWKISFPSRLVGYVSVENSGGGANGKVLKTTDGGMTWTELAVPGGRSMQGIGFISETEGWTSGRGTSRYTTDGGLTWGPASGLDGSVNRFEFFGDSLAYAMGQQVFQLVRPVSEAASPGVPALTLAAGPNPATGPVSVRYATPAGPATVVVFDALGRRVATLADGAHAEGAHTATWAPGDLAPGLYVVRLTAGDSVRTLRIVRL